MKDNNLPLARRSFMQSLALASTGLYLGGTSAFAQDQRLSTPGATVATSYGQARGLLRDGIQQFWGLAYGASTAGENRFMPPRPPASWSGVQDHFVYGKRCYQAPGAGEPAPVVLAMNPLEEESEDCLRLNVFTPAADNKARPVMVWMHGGGFNAGSGNYLMYDGTYLAKKEDVVLNMKKSSMYLVLD
jgi:para-nitrobenzyl esterase